MLMQTLDFYCIKGFLLNCTNASVTKTICKLHCRNDHKNFFIDFSTTSNLTAFIFCYLMKKYIIILSYNISSRKISKLNQYLLWYQNFWQYQETKWDQISIIKKSIRGGLTSMPLISAFDNILQVMFSNIAGSAISNIYCFSFICSFIDFY